MDTEIYRLESRDFAKMEQALSAWNHEYQHIGPGGFRGSDLHTRTGSLGIFRNRWERAIHYQGVPPEGTIGSALSTVQTGEARWMSHSVGLDDMIVLHCGIEDEVRTTNVEQGWELEKDEVRTTNDERSWHPPSLFEPRRTGACIRHPVSGNWISSFVLVSAFQSAVARNSSRNKR